MMWKDFETKLKARNVNEDHIKILRKLFKKAPFENLSKLQPEELVSYMKRGWDFYYGHKRKEIEVKEDDAAQILGLSKIKTLDITIEDLERELKLQLSSELKKKLTEHGIQSLADIRKAGGLHNIKAFSTVKEDPLVKQLEAHARLGILSNDVKINSILINKGYTNIPDITKKTRSEFVKSVKDEIEEDKATELQAQSVGIFNYMKNNLAAMMVNHANGFRPSHKPTMTSGGENDSNDSKGSQQKNIGVKCRCKSCDLGVSPLAYLADLLDYSLQHLKKARTVDGLMGEYFDDISLSNIKFTRIDPKIDFNWGQGSDPLLGKINNFSIRWTGKVKPSFTETYKFFTYSDDGIRLWIDDELIIDNWTDHSRKEDQGSIHLSQGNEYKIKMEYYEKSVDALVSLHWVSSNQRKEIITSENLSCYDFEQIDDINLQFLNDMLNQSFGDLPATCKVAEEKVRQVRLCVEVIRKYLHFLSRENPEMSSEIPTVDFDYCLKAYEFILKEIGTSYDEIRLVNEAEEKEALAERLGIHLDKLDLLLLTQDKINEYSLEKSFGLIDTTRNPFSAGAKFEGEHGRNEIIQWILQGISWNRNIDSNGLIYVNLIKNSESEIQIELYRDAEKQVKDLVASGERDSLKGSVSLFSKNFSGLNGIFEVDCTEFGKDITLSVIPGFLSWRLSYLRSLWMELEWPVDKYSNVSEDRLPIIDPDIIGPDDLRNPIVENLPFKLWNRRRIWVDNRIQEIASKNEDLFKSAENPMLVKISYWVIRYLIGDLRRIDLTRDSSIELKPWTEVPDWTILHEDLSQGDEDKIVITKNEIKSKYHLTLEEFNYLYEVKSKNDIWQQDPRNEKVTEEEWENVVSIFVQVQKRAFFNTWIEEENNNNIKLSPNNFWASLSEPQEGNWPPKHEEEKPWIDPEIFDLTDLPDSKIGDLSRELWGARHDQLNSEIPEALKRQESFESKLAYAYGGVNPPNESTWVKELEAINNELVSLDQSRKDEALNRLKSDLCITEEQYYLLMDVKHKNDQTRPENKPTLAEWELIDTILSSVRKDKVEYSYWIEEENDNDIRYWNALKARLPRWCSSIEERQQWQQALSLRRTPPIIDPDIVGGEYLKNPFEGDKAFDLWKNRQLELRTKYEKIKDAREGSSNNVSWLNDRLTNVGLENKNNLENIIIHSLGIEQTELNELAQAIKDGKNLTMRLDQLGITRSALAYLLKVRKNAERIQLSEDEWENVYHIFIQVEKHKWLFPIWREQERLDGIILGPDYFQIPHNGLFPDEEHMSSWRTDYQSIREWEDTLQSRIDQEQSVKAALKTAVSNTEEAMLPFLRDGLINITNDDGTKAITSAKWITDHFLIDASASGCQVTTRASQAIKTIQSLLWSVRTGQLKDTYPELMLDADNFEEDWKWIGSYPSWRAALFVYMYPENILLPSLRKHQTPGFEALVEKLCSISHELPKNADKAAQDYLNYFYDICNLTVEVIHHSTHNGNQLYMFALSDVTKIVYWSTYDLDDESNYAQTFWKHIPKDDNVVKIIAASVDNNKNFLYLFVEIVEENEHKLAFTKYNLEKNENWEELVFLNCPFKWDSVFLNESAYDGFWLLFFRKQSHGFVGDEHYSNYYKLYNKKLNIKSENWDNEDWKELVGPDRFNRFMSTPLDVIDGRIISRTGQTLEIRSIGWLFVYNDPEMYHTWSEPYESWTIESNDIWSHGLKINSIRYDGIELYLFWRRKQSNQNDKLFYKRITTNANFSSSDIFEATFLDDVDNIAKPFYDSQYNSLLVCKRSGHQQGIFLLKFEQNINGQLIESAYHQIAPLSKYDENNIQGSELIISYLDEAYYYMPFHIALQLQKSGYYKEALDWFRKVYDYTKTAGSRFTYSRIEDTDARIVEMDDPLDVHAIAAMRSCVTGVSADTSFILMSLTRCFLDYADSEFTFDTPESLARSRILYMTALELLDSGELKQNLDQCNKIIENLTKQVSDSEWRFSWIDIMNDLRLIPDLDTLQEVAESIQNILDENNNLEDCVDKTRRNVRKALSLLPATPMFAEILDGNTVATTDPGPCSVNVTGTGAYGWMPTLYPHFCIPANPVIYALRIHAEINLHKLRNCLNIAGLLRDLDAYAAPTDATSGMSSIGAGGQLVIPGMVTIRPTQYRYKTLIERSKQLVNLAQQMEATFLPTLEKGEAERHNLLKARQGARMARGSVRLQDLRVIEAGHGVDLADLQKGRVDEQFDYYDGLIEGEWLDGEMWAVGLLWASMGFQFGVAAVRAGAFIISGLILDASVAGATFGSASALSVIASAAVDTTIYQSISGGFQTWSSALSMTASFERRAQEWEFQKLLAEKDQEIGTQQITIAEDKKNITEQEQVISKMESDHADDVVEFLNTKFTNVELYDWMSGIMERVYRYFLQQATSMAKLAEYQLAFQRQELPPAFIQSDYWVGPVDETSISDSDSEKTDRRGLTGSARLLQDIYRLDQYSFETDKRKLQLTRNISLARLDPFAFQRFRETGVLIFSTPMKLFDHDFPGHYLRLIKRVRTSVIALVPPIEGIRATLTSTGISRVVIGGNIFQEITIRRDPESVALTSPQNATGLFEMQQESDMLLPFEGTGVDATWGFQMPKASNPIDYRTIADVLITIEYTALDSYDYRKELIPQLDRSFSADQPFSFRHQLADQWYHLHNAGDEAKERIVRFKTQREHFPPNIQNLNIQHVTLYFALKEGVSFNEEVKLSFTEQGNPKTAGRKVKPIEGIISTRQGNAGNLTTILGKKPIGEWELVLSNSEDIKNLFKNGDLEDILFVITYSGELLQWPV